MTIKRVYSSIFFPANLPQSPANLPSDRLWLRVSYCPGWQVISPPPPLGDQEGCSMEGKGQPPPAAWPRHPTPQLPGARRGERSAAAAATVLPPPPSKPASRQHAPPPATILYEIFSTCAAKGISAKLVYKTEGARWRQVCTAAQQHQQPQQLVSPLRTVESDQTMREEE